MDGCAQIYILWGARHCLVWFLGHSDNLVKEAPWGTRFLLLIVVSILPKAFYAPKRKECECWRVLHSDSETTVVYQSHGRRVGLSRIFRFGFLCETLMRTRYG